MLPLISGLKGASPSPIQRPTNKLRIGVKTTNVCDVGVCAAFI